MATADRKAVVVGISGCSSSGKTTLARLLRDIFPNTFILHEDDFYKNDKEWVAAAVAVFRHQHQISVRESVANARRPASPFQLTALPTGTALRRSRYLTWSRRSSTSARTACSRSVATLVCRAAQITAADSSKPLGTLLYPSTSLLHHRPNERLRSQVHHLGHSPTSSPRKTRTPSASALSQMLRSKLRRPRSRPGSSRASQGTSSPRAAAMVWLYGFASSTAFCYIRRRRARQWSRSM